MVARVAQRLEVCTDEDPTMVTSYVGISHSKVLDTEPGGRVLLSPRCLTALLCFHESPTHSMSNRSLYALNLPCQNHQEVAIQAKELFCKVQPHLEGGHINGNEIPDSHTHLDKSGWTAFIDGRPHVQSTVLTRSIACVGLPCNQLA